MSDTKRKILVFSWDEDPKMITGGDAVVRQKKCKVRQKRMEPFVKSKGEFNWNRKFKVERDGEHTPTIEQKLEAKNANRSLKKGLRQQYKRELKKELEYLDETV